MTELAHAAGAVVLVDGAQAAPHLRVDVHALGCDFYAFSGHKVYGPSAIGALYGREALLEAMPPWQGGGDMIASVTLREDHLERAALQVRGGHAEHRGRDRARRGDRLRGQDRARRDRGARARAARVRDAAALRAAGPAPRRHRAARRPACSRSCSRACTRTTSGTILDHEGIAVRTGHHCAQPVMDRFGIPATARASLACYNTREELDALVARHPQGPGDVR